MDDGAGDTAGSAGRHMTAVALLVVGVPLALRLVVAASRANARDRARALRSRAGWRVPARIRPRVERALHDATIESTPESAVELWLGAVAVSATLAFTFSAALVPLVAVFGLAGGPLWLRAAGNRRTRALDATLPGALDAVTGELRAGGTVRTAIAVLAARDDVVGADLRRAQARLDLGASLDVALAAWVQERPTPSVRAVAGALAVAGGMGGGAAPALDGLGRSLRDQHGAAAEARALSAQARLSAVVVGAAPVAFLAFETATDPASTATLVGTPAGQVCLLSGIGLEILAAVWMRHIVRSVET